MVVVINGNSGDGRIRRIKVGIQRKSSGGTAWKKTCAEKLRDTGVCRGEGRW
jgi:hypothetical protein